MSSLFTLRRQWANPFDFFEDVLGTNIHVRGSGTAIILHNMKPRTLRPTGITFFFCDVRLGAECGSVHPAHIVQYQFLSHLDLHHQNDEATY